MNNMVEVVNLSSLSPSQITKEILQKPTLQNLQLLHDELERRASVSGFPKGIVEFAKTKVFLKSLRQITDKFIDDGHKEYKTWQESLYIWLDLLDPALITTTLSTLAEDQFEMFVGNLSQCLQYVWFYPCQ